MYFVTSIKKTLISLYRSRISEAEMNKLDRLLPQAHRFRGWLSQPEAALFNEYLNDYRNETLSKLTRSDNPVDIHHLQGALSVLDSMIQLRSEERRVGKECRYRRRCED